MKLFQHAVIGGAAFLFAHLTQAGLTSDTDYSARLGSVSLESANLASSVQAIDPKNQEARFSAAGNSKITSTVVVDGEKLELSGTSSFHLNASQADLKNGRVKLGAFNVVLFDVPQQALTYSKDGVPEKGNLTFVTDGAQALKYDARSGSLYGEISGFVGADYMAAYARPIKDSEEFDHVEAPKQKATMQFKMALSKPFSLVESEKPQFDRAEMDMNIRAEGDQFINAHDLVFHARPVFEIEYVIAWRIEVAKRLCVQPVRFSRLTWNWPSGGISVDYTGAGLGFGQPEANKQWAKADVLFTWRDWKTIYNPTLFFFSTSEANSVMATVNDADCVEVFFVEGDSGMHNGWGGGASWYGGESYTKIISSDGNVDAGVDFTHLAHELGHSMDLPHPTAWNSSSTNTLMCPSGFANDNPTRNSQENKDNISNPLFTFALKLVSAGPNCTNSADCGVCPPIP